MQGEGILETIAEVSVAFAGFTGVVAAFGRRSGERWSAADVFRFRGMLGTSFSALFYALLPFVLHYLGVPEGAIWRLGSTAVALQLVAIVAIQSYRARRQDLFKESSRVLVVFVATLVTVVVVTQILNALGIFAGRSFGAYLVGLAYFLVVSSIMFVRLVSPTVSDST